MLTRSLSAGFAGLVLFLSVPLSAQDRAVPPADVTVTGSGTTATIKWSAVPIDGVVYRVLRSTDGRRTGTDITEPTREVEVIDSRVAAGTTYFYQVIAVFRDATTAAAAVVAYTAPSATVAPPPAPLSAPLVAITEVAPVRTAIPTEVSGVTVVGNTTASALVSWQPVAGATSYSISRTAPGGTISNFAPPPSATSWTDLGYSGAGFVTAGTYAYTVTAALQTGGTVSGSASWRRPDPTCTAPPAGQSMLAVLDPTTYAQLGASYPTGAMIMWEPVRGALAYRVDRSEPGVAWYEIATSCAGTIVPLGGRIGFLDQLGKTVPATIYQYRIIAFAANGETGAGTMAWTAPNASTIRWLAATVSGHTVTLRFRYEPPTTNPPIAPSERLKVTAPYGLSQIVSGGCGSLAGCSLVLNGVPAGTHEFTATAQWLNGQGVIAQISSSTTVVVHP